MNFRPLRDLILVKPDPLPGSSGLLFLPEGHTPQGHQPGDSRDSFTGTVVAVGPGDQLHEKQRPDGSVRRRLIYPDGHRRAMQTKVGDRVVYPRRASAPGGGCEVMIEGELFHIFHEEQSAFLKIEESSEEMPVAA